MANNLEKASINSEAYNRFISDYKKNRTGGKEEKLTPNNGGDRESVKPTEEAAKTGEGAIEPGGKGNNSGWTKSEASSAANKEAQAPNKGNGQVIGDGTKPHKEVGGNINI